MKQKNVRIPFDTAAQCLLIRDTLKDFGYEINTPLRYATGAAGFNCIVVDHEDVSRGDIANATKVGHEVISFEEFIFRETGKISNKDREAILAEIEALQKVIARLAASL